MSTPETFARRNRALQRNYALLKDQQAVVFQRLLKSVSSKDWEPKLTGVHHWNPEQGYEVFLFDPDNEGSCWILVRHWDEATMSFKETMQKHHTGHSELPQAMQAVKDWVKDHWDALRLMQGSSEPEKAPAEETPKPATESLAEEIQQAVEDVNEVEETRFENFLDDGVRSEKEKSEDWKEPWMKRLAVQLSEMEKDRSQYERVMQETMKRRELALEKSFFRLVEKLQKSIDVIKTDQALEKGAMKRLSPNPQQYVSDQQSQITKDWQSHGNPESRSQLEPSHESIKKRTIHGLFGKTQWKKINGDVHFLLHRGMSKDEYARHQAGEGVGVTSWTHNPDMAAGHAAYNDEKNRMVVSAWIPASKISTDVTRNRKFSRFWSNPGSGAMFANEAEITINDADLKNTEHSIFGVKQTGVDTYSRTEMKKRPSSKTTAKPK